jgi:hypothetical protein
MGDSQFARAAEAGVLFALAVGVGCGSAVDGAAEPEGGVAAADDALVADAATGLEGSAEEVDSPIDASVDGHVAADGALDGASACPTQSTIPAAAGAAKSAGFSGNDAAYYALYNVACTMPSDCASACGTAGGTTGSCSVGSDCITPAVGDGGSQCLPPTYWRNVNAAISQSGMTTNAAELTLVTIDYRDALVLTGFNVSIPENATILGVQFRIRRNADDGFAIDDAVQIVQNGSPVGLDHRQPGAWPKELAYAVYGGADDTWSVPWHAADFRSSGFGISIAPQYTGLTAGNDRAHIDSARVTVFYTTPCD